MRLAPLALLAACSSSSPSSKPIADPGAVAVAVAVDAAPLAQVAPDAAPVQPAAACVPAAARLTTYADDAIVMCADTCFSVTPDGTVTEAPVPAELRSITIPDPATEVIACKTPDTCVTLQPNLDSKRLVVVDAAFDAAGARVVVAKQDPEHREPGTLELWDFAKRKRLGHGSASEGDPGGPELDVGFVGETVVSVAAGDEGTNAYFLRLTGGKLKEVDHSYGVDDRGWAAIGDTKAAFFDGKELRIIEAKKGGKTERKSWNVPSCP